MGELQENSAGVGGGGGWCLTRAWKSFEEGDLIRKGWQKNRGGSCDPQRNYGSYHHKFNRHVHLIICCHLYPEQKQRNSSKGNLSYMDISSWVTRKILINNGGEWANKGCIKMCNYIPIDIKTTAAEFPWSKGIVKTQ